MTAVRSLHLRYSIALLPLVAGFIFLPELRAGFIDWRRVVAFLVCSGLYAIFCWLAGTLREGLWAGYIHLAVMTAFLSLGLGGGLWVIILGSLIAAYFPRQFNTEQGLYHPLEEAVGRIAISGIGLLVSAVVYHLLTGQLPLDMLELSDAIPTIAGIFAGFTTIQIIGYALIRQRSAQFQPNNRNLLLLEALLMIVTVTLPPLLYQVGIGAFVVIMGLTAFQALRASQVSSARNALVRRVREMTTLYSLGQTLSNTLVLDEVLQNIYREVTKLVNATTFFIALYDDERKLIEYPLVMQDGKALRWVARSPMRGMTDRILRTHRYLLLNANDHDRYAALDINPQEVDAVAYLGVPLLVGQKIIGVMGVTHSSDIGAFKPGDIAILETIASQASLAIRNATLYLRTVRLADNLSLINRSLQDVMFNLDQTESMLAACTVAMQITGAQKSAIFLLDQFANSLKLSYGLHMPATPNDTPLTAPYQPHVYDDGARLIADINETDDPTVHQHAQLVQFQACLEVPLRSGNTIVGYIAVYHEDIHYYQPPEINLLEMLSNQITAALDNAELLQALELYASEQAQLVHLSRITSAYLDLEKLLHDVCATMQQMLAMPVVEVGLFEPEQQRIKFYRETATGELEYRYLDILRVPEIQTALRDRILNLRVYYPTTTQSSQMSRLMQDQGDSTLAIVTTLINRQVTGMILLRDTTYREFTDNDRRLIEMATNQVAGQLHNARVHTLTEEALIQRLQQLSMIEDIAGQISRTLEPDITMNSVLDAAMRSTGADLAILALLEEGAHEMTLIVQESMDGQVVRQTYNRAVDTGVIGYVARSGDAVLEGDNARLTEYVKASERPMQSTLAVPLQKGDKIIGVLNIESMQPNFFTAEQGGFIRSLAGHAAMSIDNARMLADRQHQIMTLTRLRELSLSASMLFEQPHIIQSVLQAALGVLDGQAAVLFSYDPLTDELVITDSTGHNTNDNDPLIPTDAVYQVVRDGEIHLIEKIQEHPHFHHDSPEPYTFESLVIIPIQRRTLISEVLCVTFSPMRHFQDRDRSTVETLATQIAGHLENAALNETIRSANNRMRAILDATRDGIILLDRAGRLQDANKAAAQMLGVDLNQHMREPFSRIWTSYFGQGPFSTSEIPAIVTTDQPTQDANQTTLREYVLSASGTRSQAIYVRELILPVQDAMGRVTGSLLVLRDISEERELAIYREKLQDMVLHDLIKPLNAIISGTNVALMILDDMGITNPEDYLRHSLQITLDSAWYLDTLARSLRDIPRLGKGEVNLERTPVSVRLVSDKAFNLLAYSLKEANIQLEYDVEPECEYVNADVELIKRIFINLLHNAFKFTPQNGRVLVSTEPIPDQPDFLRIMVSDTGPGIPPDQRKRIFDEFEQIETLKPQRGGKGSGVGLAFCRLAVEAHGGRIWVEPEGRLSGACIAMTLPRT